MPSCIVSNCHNRTGDKEKNPNIILHTFPRDVDRIVLWLSQTGQNFEDIHALAQKIQEGNKSNKYVICSEHFAPDCYRVTHYGRALNRDAIPTIFPVPLPGESIIEESLKKKMTHSRKRVREVDLPTTSMVENIPSCESLQQEIVKPGMCSISTQTDFNLKNSILNYIVSQELVSGFGLEKQTQIPSIQPLLSTPRHESVRRVLISTPDVSSPQKKKKNIRDVPFIADCDISEGICFLSPIHHENVPSYDFQDDSVSTNIHESEDNQSLYVPGNSSLEVSDLFLTEKNEQKTKKKGKESIKTMCNEQLINEKKILVFESCLEQLFTKVKCQSNKNCPFSVTSWTKHMSGSYCKYKGICAAGHKFILFETQPMIGDYAAGNILIGASILFSGQNFQKIKEFFNILDVPIISEKSYYRYQMKFLFPAIDINWEKEKKNFFELKGTKPLCVSGDGQCDSPGHSAKYCIYTVMDNVSKKVIDFEVVQRSQCTSSVAMEKFGFDCVLQRITNKGFQVKIFASDRHVGVRNKLKTDYPSITQQFDVWHYAKSLKKKLQSASKLKFAKEITPWIDKIIVHFWWSIQNCENSPKLLAEKWLSLLHHIKNEHKWDGELYSECAHGPIEDLDRDLFWLKEERPPYQKVEEIVASKQLLNDLPHLAHNCHTGQLENFHSLALKYRSKRIHFGIDAMEARTKLAALTHNNNVGRDRAVVSVAKKNTEAQGTLRTSLRISKGKGKWIIRNIYEKMNVDYIENLTLDVIGLVRGEITSGWISRAPNLPQNLLNLERPCKEDIKKQQQTRFKCTVLADKQQIVNLN